MKAGKPVAIVSYDEKPGIQAIATTAPDLPPVRAPTQASPGITSTSTTGAQSVSRQQSGTCILIIIGCVPGVGG
jgi:hypothetical protein